MAVKATTAGKAKPAAQVAPVATGVATPAETSDEATLLGFAAFAEKTDEGITYVVNVAKAQDAFDRHTVAAVTWDSADTTAAEALANGAEAVMDLRIQFELPSGQPDVAGNSDQYAKAFNAQFTADAEAKGMSPSRIADWRNGLRQYMTRTRYADIYVAKHVVATVPGLASKTTKVGKVDVPVAVIVEAATKEGKIPQPVREAMTPIYSAQVSKPKADGTPGKRLPGFQVVPAQFGVKPPPARAAGAGNTGHATPSGLWEKLILETPRLAPLAYVNKLRELGTAGIDAHLGEPGKGPKQPAVSKDGDIASRPDVIEGYRLLASLFSTAADVMEGMEGATKDTVAAFRYVPEK